MQFKVRRSLKKDLTYNDAKREIFSDEDFLKELGPLINKKKIDIGYAKSKADKYLKEISARHSESRIFWIMTILLVRNKIIQRFKKIHYNKKYVKKISNLLKNKVVAIAPNHRSVFDFIILGYILIQETSFVPIILAAEVFNVFPIETIFRRWGAYFVRRSETDEIYFLVFKHYVMLILKYELIHMFFIEGGRNKTGGYSSPKKGILRHILDGKKKFQPRKDLIFLPVNISYDYVPESKIVVEEAKSGKRKHIFKSVINYLTGKNLGNCYINFGEPISTSRLQRDVKSEDKLIDALGNSLMDKIKSLVIVSPTALLCYTLLNKNKINLVELKKKFRINFEKLKSSKKNVAYVDLNKIMDYILFADDKGIIKFDKDKQIIFVDSKQRHIVEYYSNNILHLFE